MIVKPGAQYCGEHQPLPSTEQELGDLKDVLDQSTINSSRYETDITIEGSMSVRSKAYLLCYQDGKAFENLQLKTPGCSSGLLSAWC